MPYSQRPFRTAVAAAACVAACVIPQYLRPAAGADGALLVTLCPVIAAAWWGSWREALVAVWAGVLAVQLSPPPAAPIFPNYPTASAAFWGTVFAVVGTAGCLTLRRQGRADVERACDAIRERFRLLMGQNPIPMFLGTADGRVTEANAAWNRVVGVAARSGQVARWDGRTGAEVHGPPADAVGHADVTYRRSGGADVSGYRFVIRLSRDEVFGVFLDQSLARQTESDLRRENEGLNVADARKDEALAILAHELRNPLAPILNASELIRRVTTTADRDRWARVVETQVKVLIRLVDDLLDVMRIRRGKVQIKKVTTDLSELVAAATESIRPEMDRNRHDFFVGVPTDGPVYVEADPQRLAQVLNNLLANAAKYTEPGGRIDISLEKTPGGAAIVVRDSGQGIDPEFLPYIWDMFAQHRTGLDRFGGGIGIGLTLVKKLVELHGGTVTARSDGPGLGSEFVVTLPRPALSWKNLPRPASAPPPTKTPRRVLVVEDNYAAAETAAAQLRMDGHAATVVHDGPAAIATAATLRPDVILLDIGLPGMNGYEIARRLRDGGCGAVIVAVTGCATVENHAAGADAGIDHYLLKPVAFDVLRGLIETPRPSPGRGVGYDRFGGPPAEDDTRERMPLVSRNVSPPPAPV